HCAPGLSYTTPSPPQGWCEHYLDNFAISDCEDQLNRIDGWDDVVWFVLVAWGEDKVFSGVEVGFKRYPSDTFEFTDHGPCFRYTGLELPTSGWPGPGEGTAIVAGRSWIGNFVPVYYFTGYAYGTGVLQLGANPHTGFGGMANSGIQVQVWAADAFGGVGCHTDGVYACPKSALTGLGGGDLRQGDDDREAGGFQSLLRDVLSDNPPKEAAPTLIPCYLNGECIFLPPSECLAENGEPLSESMGCAPHSGCSGDSLEAASWGAIKSMFR
ncbi:MAG: hypothetical protein KAY24_09860, partial [Candidatus Eisenbacteria sp.]|nr:hypothetical protein [Candidatus Eisenbacteria bacterium]